MAPIAPIQQVIGEFRDRAPGDLAVDITRGAKAMSAALMLAAFRHRISNVRYVEGDRDKANPGVIVPGSERVRDIRADAAINHRTLDDAALLFEHGDFAAASLLLGRLPAADVREVISIASFYSAWDRLDYQAADEIAIRVPAPPGWTKFAASPEARQWVHRLAQPWPGSADPDYAAAMGWRLRPLIVDVLANGRRCIRRRQFEDALLRAYRVLEMIGQARLFDRGLDSAALPPDHETRRAGSPWRGRGSRDRPVAGILLISCSRGSLTSREKTASPGPRRATKAPEPHRVRWRPR